MWGDIPLITEEVTNVNDAFNHTRTSTEEIYQQIIADLQFASDNLPASYDNANIGRATKGASQTLLAKVYLTRHDWQSCLTLLNTVISSQQYRLLDNFADVFAVTNKNNAESIFEVQFDGTAEGQGYPGQDPLISGSDVNNLPSDNLLALFEANQDDRYAASVIDMGTQGWRLYKWHGTKGTNNGMNFNIMVLRYADVLLSLSEILVRQNNEVSSESLELLNRIRRRAGIKDIKPTDYTSPEEFLDLLLLERGHEFWAEGHRRADLIRFGKFVEYAKKNGIPVSTTAKIRQAIHIPTISSERT